MSDKKITIIHLTDLHMSINSLEEFNALLKDKLIEDIKKRVNNKIDFLFITGDLVDKGGMSFKTDTYQSLKKVDSTVIQIIAESLELEKESIFIIPGNHDIDRNADSKNIEDGIRDNLTTIDEVNQFIRNISNDNTEGIKRILPYRKYEKEFYEKYSSLVSDTIFDSTFIKDTKGFKLGISCLNSSWRCYDSKKDDRNIVLGEYQLINSYSKIKDCDIKIALIHHHVEYLKDFEKEQIENFLLKHYDLVFFGHSHYHNNYSKKKGDDTAIWIGSPSAFINFREDSRKYSSGYTICEIDKASVK